MTKNIIVVAVAAVTSAVVAGGGGAAFVALSSEESSAAGEAAESSPAAEPSAPAEPRPTVTVTKKPGPVRTTVIVPPRQRYYGYGGADERFLAAIAADGIKAPDDWAVEAGRETCGASYDYAYNYLTDGGLYSYHVQTFLDDWTSTHGGC
ncbi:DUF732 domain-containing protein [Actinomadura fibrosa]|uniref:DUF732 domain-containing protein n=1 Tax=Actinomadura fibrosa TaxID=111802 RepID=A0ABW2XUG5_9ACTN|nr:DUF732 domain-containing protein [Actinomadura fibrosa]